MKRIFSVFALLLILFSICTCAQGGSGWYCPSCGRYNDNNYCPADGTARPSNRSSNGSSSHTSGNSEMGGYPLQVYLGNRSCGEDEQNMIVYWVQTQLKATGRYYQGYQWDVTGNLGDHTMSEIRSFMGDRGYSGHSGRVDQNVIDELTEYFGGNPVPVYVGGCYEAMNSIMTGGSSGSMHTINNNLNQSNPRSTVGGRWIQVCLKYLGYYKGSVNGKFGQSTVNAVKRFQADHDFEQRDHVTLGVARTMLEEYIRAGGSVNDLP